MWSQLILIPKSQLSLKKVKGQGVKDKVNSWISLVKSNFCIEKNFIKRDKSNGSKRKYKGKKRYAKEESKRRSERSQISRNYGKGL